MELEEVNSKFTPWGITSFDNDFDGLPTLTFNLLRSYNKETNIAAIGHFLQEGLFRDQKVVLVSFDNPVYLMSSFKEYGFLFDEELIAENLIYLYYKPFFSHSINFSTNHQQLFSEIKSLSKGGVRRIAFLNADVLFNLETYLLAESSAERIMASFSDGQCTVLGCYQAIDSQSHQKNLDEVCQSSLSSYIEIKPADYGTGDTYELIIRKSPVCHENKSIELKLSPQFGFNYLDASELIKHG